MIILGMVLIIYNVIYHINVRARNVVHNILFISINKDETKHFAKGFHEGRWEEDVNVLSEQIIDNISGQYEMF